MRRAGSVDACAGKLPLGGITLQGGFASYDGDAVTMKQRAVLEVVQSVFSPGLSINPPDQAGCAWWPLRVQRVTRALMACRPQALHGNIT